LAGFRERRRESWALSDKVSREEVKGKGEDHSIGKDHQPTRDWTILGEGKTFPSCINVKKEEKKAREPGAW